ncbi:MAG: glycosyltransferase [Thermogemmata sp.]
MRADPRVTVVVPSYNKPQYLPECLRSIQAQTLPEWECIVVDDGSPRGEEIRVAVEAMGDTRFRLVKHEVNRGAAAARNTGFEEASGPYVLIVDEDDRLVPNALETFMDKARRTGAEIIASGIRRFDGWNSVIQPRVSEFPECMVRPGIYGSGLLIRKDVWLKVGKYDESPIIRYGFEDYEFTQRLYMQSVRLHIITEPLYEYRAPREDNSYLFRNWTAQRYSSTIHKYIVNKHADFYDRYPDIKKMVLAKGYMEETRARLGQGDLVGIVRCVVGELVNTGKLTTAVYLAKRLVTRIRSILGR